MGELRVPWRNWEVFLDGLWPAGMIKNWSLMMFSLSESAKSNLEAVLHELRRASLQYGHLYHERLLLMADWKTDDGKNGRLTVPATTDEWTTFIEYETQNNPSDEWEEWEINYCSDSDWDQEFVSRWFGAPEGKDTFLMLIESALKVLQHEDFAISPDEILSHCFTSVDGWLHTLHDWASWFQMPLLSSSQEKWIIDNDVAFKMFGPVKYWTFKVFTGESLRYPFCSTLNHDIFTSSMTAIRALLHPDLVISTENKWQIAYEEESPETLKDQAKSSRPSDIELAKTSHVISYGPRAWEVWFHGSEAPFVPKNQAGLFRLATLIESEPKEWDPFELELNGARNIGRCGRVASVRQFGDDAPELYQAKTVKNANFQKPDQTIAEEKNRLMAEKKEWLIELADARKRESLIEIEEAEEQLARLNIILNDQERNLDFKKAKDRIRASISKTLMELKDNNPARIDDIKLLQEQIDTASTLIRFTKNPKLTPWLVRR